MLKFPLQRLAFEILEDDHDKDTWVAYYHGLSVCDLSYMALSAKREVATLLGRMKVVEIIKDFKHIAKVTSDHTQVNEVRHGRRHQLREARSQAAQ